MSSHIPRNSDVGRLFGNGSGSASVKITAPMLRSKKGTGEKIAALTAYDYPSALMADAGGMDLVLVGDSLANTALGYESTLPVSTDEMLVALRAVRRAVQHALLVIDMPFGSYTDTRAALETAVRFVKAGAEAIKLEGGQRRAKLVQNIVENDIPVIGHIGLTPQSLHALGGYRVQGRRPAEAEQLVADAESLEKVGAFAIVLEGIPVRLAEEITERVSIPTIGIGAGPHCDGQILVFSDLLGLLPGKTPKFVRQYVDVYDQAQRAIQSFRDDIRAGTFPSLDESYESRIAAKTASG